jgi:hypothetical protein
MTETNGHRFVTSAAVWFFSIATFKRLKIALFRFFTTLHRFLAESFRHAGRGRQA